MTSAQRPAGREAADDRVTRAVTRFFAEERVAVLATLIRHVGGDFQLAEDALQDALASAVRAWRRDGVPRKPGAWITVAARRSAIDRLRRESSQSERAGRLAESARLGGEDTAVAHDDIEDDRLRLVFTACHPALAPAARVALTLRVVGGLTTGEIARAFLVAEPTMGKRIVRAKRKIAAAGIAYRVPTAEELPERLEAVLRVAYLIFNEGYSASAGAVLVRGELCAEAIRLQRLLAELLPEEAEVWGLLALILLHDARRASRVSDGGDWVALTEQDPATWDRDRTAEGVGALTRALRLGAPGPYQLQAAVTALHMKGVEEGATDWPRIAHLYGVLAGLDPSPVVALNRAAAVGFAEGPERGLALLGPLLRHPALSGYPPLHATHADLLGRSGDPAGAAEAYRRAIALSTNDVERAELRRRLGRSA
ncbi:RNA polymerase sigma factor [Streptomyces sp. NPDC086783]|uniref:RNA polymerase sigma factor n=1 Tax=Streptomyces sp. NPDC086783 TaxID=3365758 RepID=UPI0037F567C3